MRICMVFYDMQDFGGLEEYASTLALGLQAAGHEVSAVSAAWVPPHNQYLRRLHDAHVPVVHPPRWVSHPASNWRTKERILDHLLRLLAPVTLLGTVWLVLARRISWQRARASATGRLRGTLQRRFTAPDRRQTLARALLSYWRFRWRPDLLHIQGYTTSQLFVIEWAHRRRLPVVYEEHQTPDAMFNWWDGFDRSLDKANVVVAVSEKSAEALRAVCGVGQRILVRNPLLPDPLTPNGCKAQTSLRVGPIRITTVARLYVTKGLSYLLEAIVEVRGAHPGAEFRVYGDGPLREELRARAEDLGLEADAIFPGAFTDRRTLARIMAETDIFVLPSILEGQPLALVEAMAYGCPIVATSVGGIPELIDDGVNGLLCEPKDPSDLARKVCTLIEDPALRVQLGAEARRTYERSHFQPAAVSRYFVSLYESVLENATAAAS